MKLRPHIAKTTALVVGLLITSGALLSQEAGKKSSSYSPVVIQEDFATVMARMSAAKPAIMQRQKTLLDERYDLSDRPARGVTMSRGKAVQEGVRTKLRGGMTWERLTQMGPEEIRDRDVFPLGFMPLPHPNHAEGGMLFPKYHIDEIKKLQKLAAQQPPFVKYEKHHGVRLTARGKMRALEVLRHHRLLERFLHDFLDYSWDEVHDEAERLEHFISERLEDRIAAKLGDPETDPHGHLIPERGGTLPARDEVLLSRWACGVSAVISSVSDRDPAALRETTRLGLKPGVAITVETGTRNASLRVRIGDRTDSLRLSQTLASGISVVADQNGRIRSESGLSPD